MPIILTLFSAVMRKLTPAEVDGNFTALLNALGGFTASQAPGANQIPVVKADGSTALPGLLAITAPSGTSVTGGLSVTNSSTAATGNVTPIALYVRSSNWGTTLGATIAAVNADGVNGGAYLTLSTASSGQVSPTEKVRVLGNGNILIGTPTDSGSARMQVQCTTGAATAASYRTADYAAGTTGSSLLVDFGATSGNTYAAIKALSAGGTVWNNLALQYGGGKVLMGAITESGTDKLQVTGRIMSVTGVAPYTAITQTYPSESRALYSGQAASLYSYIGSGYYNNSSLWRTGSVSAANIRFADGIIQFTTDTGLTAGANFTPTERMRIDAAGNLLAGVTSGSTHTISKAGASNYAVIIQNTSATSPYGLDIILSGVTGGAGNNMLECRDTGGIRAVILGSGNIQNVNNSYGAYSDIKLKANISPARQYLADLCKVNVVKYSLKSEASETATHLGVIAQEVELIFPGMIEETSDIVERASGEFEQKEVVPAVMDGDEIITPAVMGDDETKPIMERYETGEVTKGVKYSIFVPMLITAVQELSAQNKALEVRLSALEAML